MHGVHAVVGTTGLDDADIDTFRHEFSGSNCVIASNFAISAVLMMKFAELAAPYFDSAEIIELHHEDKIDAPSGTAVSTAKRMAAASDEWTADPTQHEAYPGSRGGVGPAGIHVHSVRMRGLVAHQEVILGAHGQTLTIRQDSYDNASFMPGWCWPASTLPNTRSDAGADSFPGMVRLNPAQRQLPVVLPLGDLVTSCECMTVPSTSSTTTARRSPASRCRQGPCRTSRSPTEGRRGDVRQAFGATEASLRKGRRSTR